MFDRFAGDELRDQIVSIVPVGRVGASDEIAAAVLYLASDAAKFTTAHHWWSMGVLSRDDSIG